jgi:hypothetical protein
MLRPALLLAPALLALSACDATYSTGAAVPGMVTSAPATDLSGTPDFQMARRACGRELAGPGGLMRVEFQRDAPGGALIMLHARRDPASPETRRWRCYFDYATRTVRAFPA